jgi:hypothetical protein
VQSAFYGGGVRNSDKPRKKRSYNTSDDKKIRKKDRTSSYGDDSVGEYPSVPAVVLSPISAQDKNR